ncbi:glutathione S-transferase family protein [Sneathiella sp.]|uniref:glutathione S-transferase family protein n=1 Tax=Sneathiella sp. TaxID=1964365 RepID=UPI0039E5A71C
MPGRLTVYHIPVCPFSQRLEILLTLKGQMESVRFQVVDITKPRDTTLLKKTNGTTALPVLETEDGLILKESLVILRYLEERFPEPQIARSDPYERAVERMLIARENAFAMAGYLYVMNQNPDEKQNFEEKLLELYREFDAFLMRYNPEGVYLFDDFGLAEVVFTPFFMRFWFLDYYENFSLPFKPEYNRVRRWQEACLNHSTAQQVSREEIVKLYFDYALGAGNGALPTGRERSSFLFEPHWRSRPWPPKDKYTARPDDQELGLV